MNIWDLSDNHFFNVNLTCYLMFKFLWKIIVYSKWNAQGNSYFFAFPKTSISRNEESLNGILKWVERIQMWSNNISDSISYNYGKVHLPHDFYFSLSFLYRRKAHLIWNRNRDVNRVYWLERWNINSIVIIIRYLIGLRIYFHINSM